MSPPNGLELRLSAGASSNGGGGQVGAGGTGIGQRRTRIHNHHNHHNHHSHHNHQPPLSQQQQQPQQPQSQPQPQTQQPPQPPQPQPHTQPAQQQQSLVTRQIYETFLRARQSNETYIQKARLREKLYNILRKCFKNPIDLYIVGSSINNLGNNNSDVDMCLIISDRDIDQTTEALPILQFVRDQISQYDFVRKSHLIVAKVPLLRFEDASSEVVVDLNVNNSVGIRNTHLINCYTRRKYPS
jgi:DNA polymerase sigma